MHHNFESLRFAPGDNLISLVNHAPEIKSGDLVKIVKVWNGNLCAVVLPDGMIHRWFASFELSLDDNFSKHPHMHPHMPGSYVKVVNTEGHGKPPPVEAGAKVKIARCIPTTFYDVILSNGEYHRWLADFEVAKPI